MTGWRPPTTQEERATLNKARNEKAYEAQTRRIAAEYQRLRREPVRIGDIPISPELAGKLGR